MAIERAPGSLRLALDGPPRDGEAPATGSRCWPTSSRPRSGRPRSRTTSTRTAGRPKDPGTFAALMTCARRPLRPARVVLDCEPDDPEDARAPVAALERAAGRRSSGRRGRGPRRYTEAAPRGLPRDPPRRPRRQGRGRLARSPSAASPRRGSRRASSTARHARRYFDMLSVHPFTDGTVPVKESVRQRSSRSSSARGARCAAAGTGASRSSSPSSRGPRRGARSPGAACSGSRRPRRDRSPA